MWGKKTRESVQNNTRVLMDIRNILGGMAGMLGTVETTVRGIKDETAEHRAATTGLSPLMRAEIAAHAERQLAASRALLDQGAAGDVGEPQ